jgi:glycosyltransferase involved in cell wall biosynthesis
MTLLKRYSMKSVLLKMKSIINYLLNKILSQLGYTLIKNKKSPKVLANVFNTSYHKTVLLSYIKSVFENQENINDRRHTNRYTTYLIAQALKQLEYNVDVVDCSDTFNSDFSKYSLVIGMGNALDYVLEFREGNSQTKVIWFGTGCNPLFSNVVTLKRVGDFYRRNNKLIVASSRYIKEDWPLQHEFADWIILHGSTFAKSTYRTNNISTVNAPVFINQSVTRTDDEWLTTKQNYLWFGVGGLIHKGLDLLIDSFKEIKNCNLHICGDIESEKTFFDHYSSIIDSSVNIICHGFIDVSSQAFEEILHDCAFVIFPSASEGNSPSVITCMANGGLIPVVSQNADVDLKGYGVLIDDLSVDAVIKSIEKSQELSVAALKIQSAKIVEDSLHLNSFDYFKNDFKQKLQEAINAI